MTICSETFGDRGDPAVLLIMGAMASMLWWPDGFCARLARAGRFVIRYDNRDTGRSTGYEPGTATYTGDDLVGRRRGRAGRARGGAGARGRDVDGRRDRAGRGARVPGARGERDRDQHVGGRRGDPGLPGPTAEYMEHAAAFDDLDWSDTQALADLIVEDARHLAGTRHPFDEAAARELVTRDLERAIDPRRLANHGSIGGDESRWKAGRLAVPLLVIHGSADPLLPHPHGVALAEAVPGATLVTIEGGGHELHERDWDQILGAIVAHTAAA